MGYIYGEVGDAAIGGSSKEPLLEAVVGKLQHTINPGDKVFTFTSTYGKSTRICSGIYQGVIRKQEGRYTQEKYVVERADGKRTLLNYNGMVPAGTTLEELDDQYV